MNGPTGCKGPTGGNGATCAADGGYLEKNSIAASSASTKPAHSGVAWWWFALGGASVLALIGAPRVARRRADR